MTSDKAQVSEAQRKLNELKKGHHINLNDLNDDEFENFLTEHLVRVDLRELRGFKPLFSEITRRENTSEIPEGCSLRASTVNGYIPFEVVDLKSQVVRVCQGVFEQHLVFKHYETNEETSDFHTASLWGSRNFYVFSKREKILVIRRPRNHTTADENLMEIEYFQKKIPKVDAYHLQWIVVSGITTSLFRKRYGKKSGEMAVNLIREITLLHDKTHRELVSQTDYVRRKLGEWDALNRAICA